jgi:alpha-galactosidase
MLTVSHLVRRLTSLAVAVAVLGVSVPHIAAEAVVRSGSASISNDTEAGTWTISSAGTSLTLALDPGRDFQVLRLASTSGEPRTAGGLPDTQIAVGGKTLPFGSRSAGFVYQSVSTSVRGLTVQLDATFDLPSAKLRATRHYAATSGSPTFEAWTTFTPLGSTVTLSDLSSLVFTVAPGTLHWLNGLQGDAADALRHSAFSLQARTLEPGEQLTIGSPGRSSEQTVPWLAIENGRDVFYAGLLWSGAWSISATRGAAGIDLTLGLAPMSTSVSSTIDGPHVFFGVNCGTLADASAALRSFVVRGLRESREFDPLVTYNTWFAYGVKIDEASMREEIDGAAEMGAELFVLDAGWYVGAGRDGSGDYTSGLGSWQVDASRFPSGLRALRDHAHARGIKFGIWVEPERIAQSTVGRAGLAQEGWLAKNGGKLGSSDAAQLCFGSAAARQWVLDRITALIDSVQPDYLKWDNNFWINCNRSGHVHGATDGNFAHVNGLYDILSILRARYPDLLIENVSGGGNRLDLGMLRYSDVGWMDDRTTPSSKVRHNIQGLSRVFPPAYLLSFVMHDRDETLHGAPDLPLLFRSRMSGILGLCFRTGEFEGDERDGVAAEIAAWKGLRGSLRTAAGALLTPQAAPDGGPAWDVLQTTPSVKEPVVLWAFQTDPGVPDVIVHPVTLRPQTLYEVRSVDVGPLGILSGAELMADGIGIVTSPYSAAHVIVLTAVRER